MSDFPKTFNRLIEIVEKLINVVSFLLALTITLLMKIFFFDRVVQTFNMFDVKWDELSEGYQLLILGAPLAFIMHILGHVVIKIYIDPLIEKSHTVSVNKKNKKIC